MVGGEHGVVAGALAEPASVEKGVAGVEAENVEREAEIAHGLHDAPEVAPTAPNAQGEHGNFSVRSVMLATPVPVFPCGRVESPRKLNA
ncbi:hypothetical protein [Rhodococcus wratislaviensis]|nr:hypothetical protein [Rhodococcus wratislaviensis]